MCMTGSLMAADKQLRDCTSTTTPEVGLNVRFGMNKLVASGDRSEQDDIFHLLSPTD
ncbi:hypothetical protein HDV57DRAFT_480686 [Trichoderma longibrachiatum]